MELSFEIQRIKNTINSLVDVVDALARKQVELEREARRRLKPEVKPEPQAREERPDRRNLWVRANDICRSDKNPDSLLPISRAAWYRGVREGRFPAPRKVGKMSLWRYDDIDKVFGLEGEN